MVSGVPAKTFTVELERVQKTGTMFRVPFDLGDAGAKRPETRVRRIAATVDRVAPEKAQR